MEDIIKNLLSLSMDEWVEIVSNEDIQKKINSARSKAKKKAITFASSFNPPTLEEVVKFSTTYKTYKNLPFDPVKTAETYYYTRVRSDWTFSGGKLGVKNWTADFIVSLSWSTKNGGY